MKTNAHSHHHGHHAHDASIVEAGSGSAAQAVDKPYIDPVCGMKVGANPEKEIEHGGQTYHFCSTRCMDEFRADPAAYTGPGSPDDGTAATMPEGTIYICPMHPEIRQPAPGTCSKCGMALEPEVPTLEDEENPELIDFSHRFWWTLPLSVAVFVLAMFGHLLFPQGLRGQNWIELALSTPVVLRAGWPFFVRWAQSIANRSPNMWTLIGTGVAAAYVYSVVAVVAPHIFPSSFASHGRVSVYFEAAAAIISLTLLGQLLELRARPDFGSHQVAARDGAENGPAHTGGRGRGGCPADPGPHRRLPAGAAR